MNNIKIVCCLVLSMAITGLSNKIIAQNQNDSIKTITNSISEDYTLQQNLWMNTVNATGLSIDTIEDYGHLFFAESYKDSKYKTTYNPDKQTVYGMNAYGYKSLDKIFLQGGFSYYRSDEDNIDWSLQMDPERVCPVILADSIGGDWKKDYYKLNMNAATIPVFGFIRFGVGIDYNVSSGGRDNDPRPKATVKDLSIRPAISFDLNEKNNLGFSYLYGDYRQDIEVMNKYGVGGSTTYKILGLALKEKPITEPSIKYRIDRWENGVAIQYGHRGNKMSYITEFKYKLLTEKGIDNPYKSTEDLEEGIIHSTPDEDYKYAENEYGFYGALSIKGNNLHLVKVNADYYDGKIYNMSTQQVELKNNKLDASVAYALFTAPTNTDKRSKFLFNVHYKNSENENLYYAVQTIEKINFTTSYEKALILSGKRFSFDLKAQYSHNLNSDLNIDPQSDFIEPETDITDPYVIYNYNYLTSNYITGGVGIKYYGTFKSKTNYYVGLKGERLQVIKSSQFEDEGITSVSLNIGVLF